MNLTEKQLNCIFYALWQAEKNEEIDSAESKGEEWFKENIDRGTASDVISLLKEGNLKVAVNQLNHLGANIKYVG